MTTNKPTKPTIGTVLKSVLNDLVSLRIPVTAAALVATLVAVLDPLGVDLGGDTTAKVTGALVALGLIAQYIKNKLKLSS